MVRNGRQDGPQKKSGPVRIRRRYLQLTQCWCNSCSVYGWRYFIVARATAVTMGRTRSILMRAEALCVYVLDVGRQL